MGKKLVKNVRVKKSQINILSLLKLNIKQKCARIGKTPEIVNIKTHVHSLTVILNLSKRLMSPKIIKLNCASAIIKNFSVHMAQDANFYMEK